MRNILARLALVTTITLGALGTFAAPAAADPIDTTSCDYGTYLLPFTSYNDCIRIGDYSDGDWRVVVGLDINVPTAYAQQEILDCPASFSAELWGADTDGTAGFQWVPHSGDQFLTWLPISAGPTLGSGVLGIEFAKTVGWQVLNEDNGTDEVYVLIKFNDCRVGQLTLRTNNIVHNF